MQLSLLPRDQYTLQWSQQVNRPVRFYRACNVGLLLFNTFLNAFGKPFFKGVSSTNSTRR